MAMKEYFHLQTNEALNDSEAVISAHSFHSFVLNDSEAVISAHSFHSFASEFVKMRVISHCLTRFYRAKARK